MSRNVPLRQPKQSDSTGYKVLYFIVMIAIVGGLWAYQNGYLDRFLAGTPLEQYATGKATGNGTGYGHVIDVEGAIDPNTLDTEWTVQKAPNYYALLDSKDAHIDFEVERGQFVYTGWDKLGRTMRVYGCPTHQTWADSAGWRAPMPASADRISTWGATSNQAVTLYNSDGSTYTMELWNRSHLIGDALGAATSELNLIKASRQQNVGQSDNLGGMRYPEKLAEDYLKSHEDGYVYYSATPIYNGNELMARAVYVQVQSNDKSINQAILVYNAAYGYQFNYADGTYEHIGI